MSSKDLFLPLSNTVSVMQSNGAQPFGPVGQVSGADPVGKIAPWARSSVVSACRVGLWALEAAAINAETALPTERKQCEWQVSHCSQKLDSF